MRTEHPWLDPVSGTKDKSVGCMFMEAEFSRVLWPILLIRVVP